MTQLQFTLEAVQQMDDPCRCERCSEWVGVNRLRPVNGSINEKAFGLMNKNIEVAQTVWVCLDCLDDER